MADLYGCRLPVHGPGASPFDISVAAVRRHLAASVGIEPSGDGGSAALSGGTELRWQALAAPDGWERTWTVSWLEPGSRDTEAPTATAATVVRERERTLLLVRQGPVVRTATLGRLPLALEPPPIVGVLLDCLVVEEDGLPLRAAPRHVDDGPALRRLAGLVLDPERVLPVVVISVGAAPGEPPGGTRPLVDAVAVARTLVGVAHVFVVGSESASFALTTLLGRSLSVFGGAVRLYWPGVTAMADPRHNTLLHAQAMADRATTSVRRALLRRLMPVALVRSSTADVEARIRAAIHQDQDRTRRRRRAQHNAPVPGRCREELRAAWAEAERRRAENIHLADQLAVRQEDLRTMAARWIAASPIEIGRQEP